MQKNLKEYLKEKVFLFIKENEYFDLELDLLSESGIIQTVKGWPESTEDNEENTMPVLSSLEIINIDEEQMEICLKEIHNRADYKVLNINFISKSQDFICSDITEAFLSGINTDEFLKELFGTYDIETILQKSQI